MKRVFCGMLVGSMVMVSSARADYERADWVAYLPFGAHDTKGIATIIDERTIQVDHFTYDGTAPLVYFYLGATDNYDDFLNGIPIGPELDRPYSDETIVVQLSEGQTLDGWGALSVWCVEFQVNFTSAEFKTPATIVEAMALSFSPADVTINPGDTVRWYRVTGTHTVTEGTDGTVDGDELFSGSLSANLKEFEFTFTGFEDTVIPYFCEPHFGFGMTGTIAILPGDTSPCEGDANQDDTVDPLDAGYVLSRFGCPVGKGDAGCDAADVNADGVVDPLDAGFVLSRFGDCL